MGLFLVVLLQQEVQAHQLSQATRGWVGTDARRAEQSLSEVSRYADVSDRLERLEVDDATEKASLARIQAVDNTTLTPVLMWLLANVSLAERRGALLALESYVVRRSLCRLTTSRGEQSGLRPGLTRAARVNLLLTYSGRRPTADWSWTTAGRNRHTRPGCAVS